MIIVTTLVIPPGGDAGPFDLYSDADGYTVPFATNVSALQLQTGYSSTVPDNATSIKVVSVGICTNFIILDIDLIPTTTTTSSTSTSTSTSTSSTSTSTSTSTTTSTSSSTTTTTTTSIVGECYTLTYLAEDPPPSTLYVRYTNLLDVVLTEEVTSLPTQDNQDGSYTVAICIKPGVVPICVFDDGINPPVDVTCNPYSWILGGSCTSPFGCLTPPLQLCVTYEATGGLGFVDYTDCDGNPQSYEYAGGPAYTFCALEDTVTPDPGITITLVSSSCGEPTTTTTTSQVYTYAGTITNNTGNAITANTAIVRVNGTPVAYVTLNIPPGGTQTFSTSYTSSLVGIGNNFVLELYTYTGVTISNDMNQTGGTCVTSTGVFVDMGTYLMATSTTTGPISCGVYVIAMTIT